MLNKKLFDKFNLFEEIDKFSSHENTKQSSFKNKEVYSFNESSDNNIMNETFNFYQIGNNLNINNKNENLNKTNINNKINKKINNLKRKYQNNNVEKIADSNSKIREKNPEKFVLQLFYDNNKKESKKKKEAKLNIYKNYTYRAKNKYNKNIACNRLKFYEQGKYTKDSQNLSFDKINNKLLNYKSMINKSKKLDKKEKKNKSKLENNPKIQKLIDKLYNEGLEHKIKKELIYQENILKKEEEYKNYPYYPNYPKKPNYSLSKLNEDLYSKQIEWKKNKDIENSKKKKYEDEIYLSQYTFKPNISREKISDDEDMIKRNLNDMNNYILKRRNQIRYKKENAFKLRDYKFKDINISNNNEQYTERICYRNKKGLNNSFISSNRNSVNYSKFDFLKAVKDLHSKIRNLNI